MCGHGHPQNLQIIEFCNPQFELNLDDEDGAEVQAMMFCAEHMRSDDDVDVCVSKVLEQVYAKAPHLRPDSEETHTNKAQEKKLNFVLQPGQDPVKETESFCRAEVLPKDVEWCQEELLKQVYAQAPQLRAFDESTSSCEVDGKDSSSTRNDTPTTTTTTTTTTSRRRRRRN